MNYYYEHESEDTLITEILSSEQNKNGWLIELKDTIFYPEGGGQPADKGLLGGQVVLDVQKSGGKIVHRVKEKPETATVLLELDRDHRDFYRIRHTGQHLISAILFNLYRISTTSVSLGKDVVSIEIDRTEIQDEKIEAIEKAAAKIIAENQPVRAFWVKNQEELQSYNVRSTTSVQENIRLLEIQGSDLTPCGGLHLDSTAPLGMIKYGGKEKVRGHLRLKWLIGSSAFAEYDMLQKEMKKITHVLSVPAEEAVQRITEVIHERDETLSLLKKAEEKTAESLCRELSKSCDTDTKLIVRHLEDCTPSLFKELCRQLAAGNDEISFLLTCPSEKGLSWVLNITDTTNNFDFSVFRNKCLTYIDGKGGGRAPRWQGAGILPEGINDFFNAFKSLMQDD